MLSACLDSVQRAAQVHNDDTPDILYSIPVKNAGLYLVHHSPSWGGGNDFKSIWEAFQEGRFEGMKKREKERKSGEKEKKQKRIEK